MKKRNVWVQRMVMVLLLFGLKEVEDVPCEGAIQLEQGKHAITWWNCSEAYKKTMLMGTYLFAVAGAYSLVEEKLPSTAEELVNSPYFFIPLTELSNYYQNRPVRVVTDPPSVKSPEIERFIGDIYFKKVPGRNDFVFGVIMKSETEFERRSGFLASAESRNFRLCANKSEGKKLCCFEEDWRCENWADQYKGMQDDEKTLLAMELYLDMASYPLIKYFYRIDKLPRNPLEYATWHPLIGKMRNIFTGLPLKVVTQPSPGDVYLWDYGGAPWLIAFLYNREGKLIQPHRKAFKPVLESNKLLIELGKPLPPGNQVPPGAE